MRTAVCCILILTTTHALAQAPILKQEPNTWVKRSPLPDAPPSPSLGYEGSFGYDPARKLLIRWAGHNQGGGGEQNAETWTFDPVSAKWTLKEPNLSPPGVCCAQQNIFDPVAGRFLRFQAFSGNHGWQWFREIYLNNSVVWSYDLARNTWRDMRTVPAPRTTPLRCAAWDSDAQVVVVFGGESSNEGTIVYDPYVNTWKRMNPPMEPPARSSGNLAYDAEHKLHILFGSQFSNDAHTWAYDLAKNEWRDLKPKIMPPTDRNDAVLVYDARNKVIVCSVNVFDKTVNKEDVSGHYETWVFSTGKNEWKKMNPAQEPQGWGSRRRIMAYIPDQNVTLMESYVNPTSRVPGVDREQQIWTYRYGDADSIKLQTRKLSPSEVMDAIERFDLFFASPVGSAAKKRAEPPITEDVVVSVKSAQKVTVVWPAAAAKEVVGYHVERAVVEVFSEDEILRLKKDTPPLAKPSVGAIRAMGAFTRLTKEPIEGTNFTDQGIDLTKPAKVEGKPLMGHRFPEDRIDAKGKPYRFAVYAYRVRAINKQGVEAGPGPYALTIPSSPQWVFSKEEGTTCHLKWAANPESGIKGYRVYRMESPRINGPGQPTTRITAEPMMQTAYSDAKAGDVTRRYWIVAVDALGQEGYPSAPTWHLRQFRKYYVPFTGEWHQ